MYLTPFATHENAICICVEELILLILLQCAELLHANHYAKPDNVHSLDRWLLPVIFLVSVSVCSVPLYSDIVVGKPASDEKQIISIDKS